MRDETYFKEDPNTDGSATRHLRESFSLIQKAISRDHTQDWDEGLGFFDNISRLPAAMTQWRTFWNENISMIIHLCFLDRMYPGSTQVYVNSYWYSHESKTAELDALIRSLVPPATADAYIHHFRQYRDNQGPPQAQQSRLSSRPGVTNAFLASKHSNHETAGIKTVRSKQTTITKEQAIKEYNEFFKNLQDQADAKESLKGSRSLEDSASQKTRKSEWHAAKLQTRTMPIGASEKKPEWDELQTRIRSMEARLKASSSWGSALLG